MAAEYLLELTSQRLVALKTGHDIWFLTILTRDGA